MQQRLTIIRAEMEKQELDCLMLTSEINRQYASGIKTSAGVILIFPEAAVFMTDFRYTWAVINHCGQYSKSNPTFSVVRVTAEKGYKHLIPELLASHGVKKLGIETDNMTVQSHEMWRNVINCEMVAGQGVVYTARQVKEASEIDAIRRAQRIAEAALEATLPLLTQSPTEREVATELVCQMLKHGAEKAAFDVIAVAGKNSAMAHGVPGDAIIKAGDFVTIDFGAQVGGYCSDMTRTFAIGHATDEMKKVYNIVLEAQLAGLSVIRGGVQGQDIDRAARKIIVDAGYGDCFGHGYGHGIGLQVHEGISAAEGVTQELPVGSTMTAEPGIYLAEKFGVRIEDLVVVTDNGYENLTEFPKKLMIL